MSSRERFVNSPVLTMNARTRAVLRRRLILGAGSPFSRNSSTGNTSSLALGKRVKRSEACVHLADVLAYKSRICWRDWPCNLGSLATAALKDFKSL